MLNPQFILPISAELVVDLFAGGGGASTGVEQAIGRHVDIAINHDPEAISLHTANHPQTRHFVSDVFEVDPLVAFDPPHLVHAGPRSWLAAKYGKLSDNWREDLRQGFAECFRVLASDGVMIFKWNETQVRLREVLTLTPHAPLFGHTSGKKAGTHWIVFMKGPAA